MLLTLCRKFCSPIENLLLPRFASALCYCYYFWMFYMLTHTNSNTTLSEYSLMKIDCNAYFRDRANKINIYLFSEQTESLYCMCRFTNDSSSKMCNFLKSATRLRRKKRIIIVIANKNQKNFTRGLKPHKETAYTIS